MVDTDTQFIKSFTERLPSELYISLWNAFQKESTEPNSGTPLYFFIETLPEQTSENNYKDLIEWYGINRKNIKKYSIDSDPNVILYKRLFDILWGERDKKTEFIDSIKKITSVEIAKDKFKSIMHETAHQEPSWMQYFKLNPVFANEFSTWTCKNGFNVYQKIAYEKDRHEKDRHENKGFIGFEYVKLHEWREGGFGYRYLVKCGDEKCTLCM